MKVDKDALKVSETYQLEINDTLEIKSNGKITNISINNKNIPFITKLKFIQTVDNLPKIEIERFFIQDDFDEIKKYYREV